MSSPRRSLRKEIRRPKTDEEYLENITPEKRPRVFSDASNSPTRVSLLSKKIASSPTRGRTQLPGVQPGTDPPSTPLRHATNGVSQAPDRQAPTSKAWGLEQDQSPSSNAARHNSEGPPSPLPPFASGEQRAESHESTKNIQPGGEQHESDDSSKASENPRTPPRCSRRSSCLNSRITPQKRSPAQPDLSRAISRDIAKGRRWYPGSTMDETYEPDEAISRPVLPHNHDEKAYTDSYTDYNSTANEHARFEASIGELPMYSKHPPYPHILELRVYRGRKEYANLLDSTTVLVDGNMEVSKGLRSLGPHPRPLEWMRQMVGGGYEPLDYEVLEPQYPEVTKAHAERNARWNVGRRSVPRGPPPPTPASREVSETPAPQAPSSESPMPTPCTDRPPTPEVSASQALASHTVSSPASTIQFNTSLALASVSQAPPSQTSNSPTSALQTPTSHPSLLRAQIAQPPYSLNMGTPSQHTPQSATPRESMPMVDSNGVMLDPASSPARTRLMNTGPLPQPSSRHALPCQPLLQYRLHQGPRHLKSSILKKYRKDAIRKARDRVNAHENVAHGILMGGKITYENVKNENTTNENAFKHNPALANNRGSKKGPMAQPTSLDTPQEDASVSNQPGLQDCINRSPETVTRRDFAYNTNTSNQNGPRIMAHPKGPPPYTANASVLQCNPAIPIPTRWNINECRSGPSQYIGSGNAFQYNTGVPLMHQTMHTETLACPSIYANPVYHRLMAANTVDRRSSAYPSPYAPNLNGYLPIETHPRQWTDLVAAARASNHGGDNAAMDDGSRHTGSPVQDTFGSKTHPWWR